MSNKIINISYLKSVLDQKFEHALFSNSQITIRYNGKKTKINSIEVHKESMFLDESDGCLVEVFDSIYGFCDILAKFIINETVGFELIIHNNHYHIICDTSVDGEYKELMKELKDKLGLSQSVLECGIDLGKETSSSVAIQMMMDPPNASFSERNITPQNKVTFMSTPKNKPNAFERLWDHSSILGKDGFIPEPKRDTQFSSNVFFNNSYIGAPYAPSDFNKNNLSSFSLMKQDLEKARGGNRPAWGDSVLIRDLGLVKNKEENENLFRQEYLGEFYKDNSMRSSEIRMANTHVRPETDIRSRVMYTDDMGV